MTQLYDNTASGAIASWDVQSISQAYNHLKLMITARGDTAAANTTCNIQFNNDSGANYDFEVLDVYATSVAAGESFAATSGQIGYPPAATATADYASDITVDILNYTGTTFNKNANAVGEWQYGTATANRRWAFQTTGWRSTAAINRITVLCGTGNFIAGSRLTIYGLL